jgi:hypothetical protein
MLREFYVIAREGLAGRMPQLARLLQDTDPQQVSNL